MSISLTSPLIDVYVSIPFNFQLGDGTPAEWDIPPGSILPPGVELDEVRGILYGVPTTRGQYAFYVRETVGSVRSQREFSLEVKDTPSVADQSAITQLILQAFSYGKIDPSQTIWFDRFLDINGKKVLAVKANDDGQERVIASITPIA